MCRENAWDKWRTEIINDEKENVELGIDMIKRSLTTKDPCLQYIVALLRVKEAEILGLEEVKNTYLTVINNTKQRGWKNDIEYSEKLTLSKKRKLFHYLEGKLEADWFQGINESNDILKKLSAEIGERWNDHKSEYWLEYIKLGEFELAKKLYSERYCEYVINDDIFYNYRAFCSMVLDYFNGIVKEDDMKNAFEGLFEELRKGEDEKLLWTYRGQLDDFVNLYYVYYKYILKLDESELTFHNVCRSAEEGLLFWRNA